MYDLQGNHIDAGVPVVFAGGRGLRIGRAKYRDYDKDTLHILWAGSLLYRQNWELVLVAQSPDHLARAQFTSGDPCRDAFGNPVYQGSRVVCAVGGNLIRLARIQRVVDEDRVFVSGDTRWLDQSIYRIPTHLEHLDDVVEV